MFFRMSCLSAFNSFADTSTIYAGTGGGVFRFDLQDDGDGVPAGIEDGGPNSGDGNNDGVPDSRQGNVTSMPSATGHGYITIVADGATCNQLQDVSVITEPAAHSDPEFSYPLGLVQFRIPCSTTATLKIYFHERQDLNGFTYRKYGPVPPDFTTPEWYTLPGVTFGTEVLAGQTVAYAEFTLSDGAIGDDTGADLVIVDQGGPGLPQAPAHVASQPVPTATEWGVILFIMLAGCFAVAKIRKKPVLRC
jgi:hypothetical protein